MSLPPCPAPADLDLQTHVSMSARTLEDAMLTNLLATAHARRDATFSFCRDAHLAVRLDPQRLIDQFVVGLGWQFLRTACDTLLFRADGLLGRIEAGGRPENCSVSVLLWADTQERGDAALARILHELEGDRITQVGFSLNWRFLDGKGEIRSASTEECRSEPVLKEAYPAIGDIKEFIELLLEAPEAVLVLQGPPGTGKTRLIRAILAAMSDRKGEPANVLYTGDSAVLERDEVFLEFITESFGAFVVEDADHLLKPRSGGNATLHRFLNIADGIAAAHDKKILFSTNLPNIRDIDPALLRPGRCFAHLHLKSLSAIEAGTLLERLCRSRPASLDTASRRLFAKGEKPVTVAEVYAAARACSEDCRRRRYGSLDSPQSKHSGLAGEAA